MIERKKGRKKGQTERKEGERVPSALLTMYCGTKHSQTLGTQNNMAPGV